MIELNPTETSIVLDGETLLAQIRQLGELGADPVGGGRTRLALTDAEKAGRDLLVQWMQELELEIKVDQIGNIFGILHSTTSEGDESPLMIGSHIDSVINAGAFDGCYGVLSGLAIARAYRKAGKNPGRAIVVGAFTNEEGVRYQPDMLGSLAYVGGLSLAEALNTPGTDGTRLGDELVRIGYAGSLELGSIRPHEYLELHIEQGPILEAEQLLIGAVENVQGISWQKVVVQGNANHAGTTPIRLRHDAGYVAMAIATYLRTLATDSGGTTLATVGTMKLEPNAVNVIARRATFTIDLRDPDEARLVVAEKKLADFMNEIAASEGVTITTERLARFEPVAFNEELVREIEAAAKRRGLSQRRMTSGAGHDAQMLARICQAAMIFVPSKGGISHNPREFTEDTQLINGTEVLLDVVLQRVGVI